MALIACSLMVLLLYVSVLVACMFIHLAVGGVVFVCVYVKLLALFSYSTLLNVFEIQARYDIIFCHIYLEVSLV